MSSAYTLSIQTQVIIYCYFRIIQEHIALAEALPMLKTYNGNSWVPILVTSPAETGTSTGTKMTVPSTAKEKDHVLKGMIEASSLICLMALHNEHHTYLYRPSKSECQRKNSSNMALLAFSDLREVEPYTKSEENNVMLHRLKIRVVDDEDDQFTDYNDKGFVIVDAQGHMNGNHNHLSDFKGDFGWRLCYFGGGNMEAELLAKNDIGTEFKKQSDVMISVGENRQEIIPSSREVSLLLPKLILLTPEELDRTYSTAI
ncbi:hypothetical protein Tco_0635563 [Tanacetum coccineum]